MTLDKGHGLAWAGIGSVIVAGVIIGWFLNLTAFFGPQLWLGVTGMAVGEILSALDRIRTDLQAGRSRID
ncbi:hypothetical protein ASF41_16265 [Methylobacterium sp. Leaf111]|uniref:hypothetical protein n=1 Tax=Methylobacterium sp. Leaf111 TaxID=1736257 RepID=UPI0006FDB3DD|nr:hypothetical protein [Methylobacterium sp. Leaf111]KQP74792.1 hypothetical protein ASF41_16265 [Methylobacterium sp. Leaf111]